jgi:hypothetical protein
MSFAEALPLPPPRAQAHAEAPASRSVSPQCSIELLEKTLHMARANPTTKRLGALKDRASGVIKAFKAEREDKEHTLQKALLN